MSSIKDVAKLAGVSTSTVSIIINGKSEERKITKETQDKVYQAMKVLDYQPNLSAKKLRSSTHRKTVALFWTTDFRDIMLARFLSGLHQCIQGRGWEYDIVIYPYENDKLEQESALREMSNFHGAIIANAGKKDIAFLQSIQLSVPIVLYNRQVPGYSCVRVSDTRIAELSFSVLQGKKNILLVHAPCVFESMELRTSVLQELLSKTGSSITELFLTENDAPHGYQLAAQIDFANTDAIYAPSDMIALGILHYCYENRIQVPQEVELLAIGNGHPMIDHFLNPSLSIIDIPLEEMAQECVELMDYLFENRDSASIEHLVEPRAIIQESCQPVDFSV